jgi:hypothetical protein
MTLQAPNGSVHTSFLGPAAGSDIADNLLNLGCCFSGLAGCCYRPEITPTPFLFPEFDPRPGETRRGLCRVPAFL